VLGIIAATVSHDIDNQLAAFGFQAHAQVAKEKPLYFIALQLIVSRPEYVVKVFACFFLVKS
jgi:hypothetical protein